MTGCVHLVRDDLAFRSAADVATATQRGLFCGIPKIAQTLIALLLDSRELLPSVAAGDRGVIVHPFPEGAVANHAAHAAFLAFRRLEGALLRLFFVGNDDAMAAQASLVVCDIFPAKVFSHALAAFALEHARRIFVLVELVPSAHLRAAVEQGVLIGHR